MIEDRLIDCLVSTGANFFHDFHETMGNFHYQGSPATDDVLLAENLVDRMYDVLAVLMQLAGRPKADVERALLSRLDFAATDAASTLFSAAYLTRFGAKTQALTGEMAGYRWRLDGEPFNADFVDSRAQTRWTPETVVLTVQGPSGVLLSFDMVRLVRASAK